MSRVLRGNFCSIVSVHKVNSEKMFEEEETDGEDDSIGNADKVRAKKGSKSLYYEGFWYSHSHETKTTK